MVRQFFEGKLREKVEAAARLRHNTVKNRKGI
jgi:hypothetical protein